MRKVIVLGALALLCTVLVAGAQAGKQATVVKLKFATYVWQPTTVAANKQIVESWNKAHPGIQVEIVPVDVNSVDKLLTSFVGGTAADVIHDEAADIAGFTQQGYLANLTPLLPKTLKQSIPKDLWATTNFGGKITGVPSPRPTTSSRTWTSSRRRGSRARPLSDRGRGRSSARSRSG